jgi:DNA topoisomerase I
MQDMKTREYEEDEIKVDAQKVFRDDQGERLIYVTDRYGGFRRKRWGRGFCYYNKEGRRIREKDTLHRIKSLVIPPAWTDVWISQDPDGHLQATGRDIKGRKQYIYHPRWNEIRTRHKFDRLLSFARVLPRIRRQVDADLRKQNFSWEKVTSIAVAFLDTAKIRIGNTEYLRENGSYGLTTLQNRHVNIEGSKIHIEFNGKGGINSQIDISNRKLARILKRCQELPGQELFQYMDDNGIQHPIRSDDVNKYLSSITSQHITAKDFRTWWGTVLMAEELHASCKSEKETPSKKQVIDSIGKVAKKLGNTRAVCRKYYIHPIVIDAFESGKLVPAFESVSVRQGNEPEELEIAERAVLRLLEDN